MERKYYESLKKVLSILALGIISLVVLAQAQNFDIKSLGFIAPQVNDKANVYNPETGEIIYDSSDSTFYGRTQASTWISLSGAPGSAVPAGVIMPYGGTSHPLAI